MNSELSNLEMFQGILDSEDQRKSHSDFLFATPSFWTGLGTLFNFAGSYYIFNYSDSPQEADLRAIESDWKSVGEDLMSVLPSSFEDE